MVVVVAIIVVVVVVLVVMVNLVLWNHNVSKLLLLFSLLVLLL